MKHRVLGIMGAGLALLLMGATACTSDGCLDNGASIPLAAFYSSGKAVTIKNLTVKGVGAPGDSVLLNNASAGKVYLPLRATSSTSSFVLSYGDSVAVLPDTLTLNYEAVPTFVSHDCGAMFFFNIDSYATTHHAIDSIAITGKVIDNVDKVSIKIYMKQ